MNLWRKFAARRWWQDRETLLQRRVGGALTVIERPGSSRILLEICCRNHRAAKKLLTEFGGRIERLPRDWLKRVLRGHTARPPLKVGKRLVILNASNVGGASVPRRSRRKDCFHVLTIPAAAAFGTGEHATTAMCLRLLEQATRGWKSNWHMLDAGTGTGILALAGRCFGAHDILAIDNDPRAIATAKENARANAIRGLRFVLGDALREKTGPGKFDVITANLFTELLIPAVPRWKTRLRKDGLMILSGVLREQESDLLRVLRANRFDIVKAKRRGKWIAIVCH